MAKRAGRAEALRAGTAAAVVAGILLSGCVSAEPQDRPPPKQPQWARPTALLVSTSFPEDTDGNGYLDQMGVTVYAFDEQFAVAPIRVDGAFTFTLTHGDGAPLAEWVYSAEETAAAMRSLKAGPGYLFKLSLADKGIERTEHRNAELHTTLATEGGTALRAKALTVTVGRTGIRPSGAE